VRAQSAVRADLRIGAADVRPDYIFDQIRSLAVTESGEILVLNDGTGQVRLFSPTGQFIRAFGGRGEGPTEWEFGASMYYGRGEVAVVDHRSRLFDIRGSLVAHFLNQTPQKPFALPFARTSDGWLVTVRSFASGARPVGQVATDSVSIQLIDLSGAAVREVLKVGAQRLVIGEALGRERRNRPPLFDGRPEISADSAGRIYVTDREAYRISVYDRAGKLIRTLGRAHTPVRISQGHLDSYAEHVRSHLRERGLFNPEAEIRSLVDERLHLPRPTNLPALGLLLVAMDGAVWVERPDLAADPGRMEYLRVLGSGDTPFPASRWDRFGPSGQYIGTVELPADFRPFAVLEDAVIGVQRDDLGVEYVVRYRVGS
jgi:hypothetical protein